jgi:hypothetical protein
VSQSTVVCLSIIWEICYSYDDLILNYDTNSRTRQNWKLKAAYAIEIPSYTICLQENGQCNCNYGNIFSLSFCFRRIQMRKLFNDFMFFVGRRMLLLSCPENEWTKNVKEFLRQLVSIQKFLWTVNGLRSTTFMLRHSGTMLMVRFCELWNFQCELESTEIRKFFNVNWNQQN